MVTAHGWTIPEACAEFERAGLPVDPDRFRLAVTRVARLPRIGETASGAQGGRGLFLYDIGQLQRLHAALKPWLQVPASGDTCPSSLDAGLLSSILALEPYARAHPGRGFPAPRGSPHGRA